MPFVLNLICAFFPECTSKPNCINLETMVEILEAAKQHIKEPLSARASVESIYVEIEMHGYNVLKYGKDRRRGQEEAPRKRIKISSPNTQPSSSACTRFSKASSPSRRSSHISNLTKLCNTMSEPQGHIYGASI